MFDEKKPSRVSKTEKGSDVTQKPTNTSYSPFPRARKPPSQGAVRIVVTGLNGVGKSGKLPIKIYPFASKLTVIRLKLREREEGCWDKSHHSI